MFVEVFGLEATTYWPRRTETPSVAQVFEALRSQWAADTMLTSNVSEMTGHPAYLEIIGLGPAVVPLLLRELETRPNHWFWALRSIAREDPAAGVDTFDGARAAWLAWGADRGFV